MPNETRSELARRIARYIGLRRLRGHRDLRALLNDCESVAWELERTAPPHVSAASIGWKATQRIKCGRQHHESVRGILTGRFDRRCKRPQLRQVHLRLTDLASGRNEAPSEVLPGLLDIEDWKRTFDGKKLEILEALEVGGTTKETAREFGVTPGRVSQLRREYETSWRQFQS